MMWILSPGTLVLMSIHKWKNPIFSSKTKLSCGVAVTLIQHWLQLTNKGLYLFWLKIAWTRIEYDWTYIHSINPKYYNYHSEFLWLFVMLVCCIRLKWIFICCSQYSLCLLIFFLLEMAIAIMGFVFPHKMQSVLEEQFTDKIIHTYREDVDLQNLIDFAQQEVSSSSTGLFCTKLIVCVWKMFTSWKWLFCVLY